jgi:signal transduction histidine kinase
MSSLRRALILLAVVGVAVGVGGIALVLTSGHMSHRGWWAIFGGVLGFSFIGTGLYAWYRRPDNRTGALMAAVGFTWFLETLGFSDNRWVFVVGGIVGSTVLAVLAHLMLAFPYGRLETQWHRTLIAAGYVFAIGMPIPAYLFFDTAHSDNCKGCPPNPLLVADNETLFAIFRGLLNLGAALLLVLIAREVVRKRARASRSERAVYSPVMQAGGAVLVALGVTFVVSIAFGDDAASVLAVVAFAALLTVPYAFLAGIVRGRLSRAGAVSQIVEMLGQARNSRSLRIALVGALGDPSLELAYWLPERDGYHDAEGNRVELPAPGSGRVATEIEHEGGPLAVIVHDAALGDDRDLVRTLGGAAALTLDNERLAAELRARIEELRASRARIVQAADEERRRLERDLHDGAQQRLVALALNLKLARSALESDPGAARELLDNSIWELSEATAELRELARGIHPAILTDRGLEAAVTALAGRAPVPVELRALPEERLAAPVESTAYFVVAEALTNVARYSQATHAEVAINRENGKLVVEVRDDGVGGADPAHGSGLRGLADRVAAVDGRLEVQSTPGAGTTVHAEIPCAR